MAVKEGWRGRYFEDFEVGDVYEHPLGRTVTTTDNIWFTLLSQNTALCCFSFTNIEAVAELYFQRTIGMGDHAQAEQLVEAAPLLWRQGLQRYRRNLHQGGQQGVAISFQLCYVCFVVSDDLQLMLGGLASLIKFEQSGP